MKYTRLIGTVIAFCLAVPYSANNIKQHTLSDGRLKKVYEMKVNGNALPFIFDTRRAHRTYH